VHPIHPKLGEVTISILKQIRPSHTGVTASRVRHCRYRVCTTSNKHMNLFSMNASMFLADHGHATAMLHAYSTYTVANCVPDMQEAMVHGVLCDASSQLAILRMPLRMTIRTCCVVFYTAQSHD
jgi:hypothetical protein